MEEPGYFTCVASLVRTPGGGAVRVQGIRPVLFFNVEGTAVIVMG